MLQYYILDTETTGLKAGYHEINQIAIIRVATEEEFTAKIRCRFPNRASPQALEIQGVTKQSLILGEDPEPVVDRIDQFFEQDGKTSEHRCIVAHNESFDRRFCHALWDDVGKVFKAHLWMCTKKFSQAYTKKNGIEKVAALQSEANVLTKRGVSYSLDNLMIGFELPIRGKSHTAIGDSRNTVTLFRHLMDQNLDYVRIIRREPHKEERKELNYDF